MDIAKKSQPEHFKNDKNIISGVFYCQSCEAIFSAYYPREYSLNCLRSVDHGRCYSCREKGKQAPEKKLLSGNICSSCRKEVKNHWEKLCLGELRKIKYEEFEEICQRAVSKLAIQIDLSNREIEFLFNNLAEKDYLSYTREKQSGLDQADIAILLKKSVAILNRKINNIPIKEISHGEFYEYCLDAVRQSKQNLAISDELVKYVYEVVCDQSQIFFGKNEPRNLSSHDLIAIIKDCSKNFRSKFTNRLAG